MSPRRRPFYLTATWRKQPPIPSRQNQGVRNQPRPASKEKTCRRCDVEIEAWQSYCRQHYGELSDIERANLRPVFHPKRP